MPDYKALFYTSQAKIAETISQLETLTADLAACMQKCEEAVIEPDSPTENEKNG